MLKLQKFIKENNNWEEVLAAKPYSIKISRQDGYINFVYSQIESDFSIDLVQECRGLILRESDKNAVCVPFFKFFNVQEPHAHKIDWDSAVVQEKIDGSIIKVWFDNGVWHVSTNGTISAKTANVSNGLFEYATFYDLFMEACKINNFKFDKLDKNYTYMFELISKFNKVVVYHKNIDILHIGTRCNKTFKEQNVDIGIRKPKIYPLKCLDECLNLAKELPFDNEGYVVVDKNFNRIKIKSYAYVRAHRLLNNGILTTLKFIELIKMNEQHELLGYYPEYKKNIDEIEKKVNFVAKDIECKLSEIKKQTFETQKDFALAVKDLPFYGFYFAWKKNENLTAKEWLWGLTSDRIEQAVFSEAK